MRQRKKDLVLTVDGRKIEACVESLDGDGFFVQSASYLDTLQDLTDLELDRLNENQDRLSLTWYGL